MPSRTAADSSVAPASNDAQMRFVKAWLSSVLRPGFAFDFISSAEAGTWTKRGGTWDRVAEILGIGSGLVPDWHGPGAAGKARSRPAVSRDYLHRRGRRG